MVRISGEFLAFFIILLSALYMRQEAGHRVLSAVSNRCSELQAIRMGLSYNHASSARQYRLNALDLGRDLVGHVPSLNSHAQPQTLQAW